MADEVTLFPPSPLKPEQFHNCTNVDTDNLPGGIMFTTESGEFYRSTLPYKVRPTAEIRHTEDCAIHGCEGWNGVRFCDCGADPTKARESVSRPPSKG